MEREKWYYVGVTWSYDLDIDGRALSPHRKPFYEWRLDVPPGKVGVTYQIAVPDFREKML